MSARVKDIARWGLCFALVAVLPRRRRGRAAGALERRCRPGGERARDHDRSRADAGRAADAADGIAARAGADRGQIRAGAAAAKASRDGMRSSRRRRTTPSSPWRRRNRRKSRSKSRRASRRALPARRALSSKKPSARRRRRRAPFRKISNALPNWKSALVAQIERYKRYPSQARARQSGVAPVAFSVDRSGGVHHARIVRSSGSSRLDQATLAWVERAQPLAAAAARHCRRADRDCGADPSTACADAQFFARQTFD